MLHGIVGLREPGRVDQVDRHVADVGRLLHRVARGPGHGRDDGAIGPQQPVEQARLAHVRCARQHGAQPLAQDDAMAGGGQQGLQPFFGLPQLGQ